MLHLVNGVDQVYKVDEEVTLMPPEEVEDIPDDFDMPPPAGEEGLEEPQPEAVQDHQARQEVQKLASKKAGRRTSS